MAYTEATDPAPAALSQTSCAAATQPLLIAWGARAIYRGPVFGLPAHRNAVAMLAVSLQGDMGIAQEPRHPSSSGFVACCSALIEPGTLAYLRPGPGSHVFVYADALSTDLPRWRKACRRRASAGVSVDWRGEDVLIAAFQQMPASAEAWHQARTQLESVLGPTQRHADPRVAAAVRVLRNGQPEDHGTTAQARALGLSPSRFQHLFKDCTGVPYRRFRAWIRMRAVLRASVQGATLTTSAHDAGFASSAHFSASFKTSFGMAASDLLAAQPVWIEDPDIEPLSIRGFGISEAAAL